MSSTKTILVGLKFGVGGLILVALGLSQAIFGWIDGAMWTRVLYCVAGFVLGLPMSLLGFAAIYFEIVGTPEEEKPQSSEVETPEEAPT